MLKEKTTSVELSERLYMFNPEAVKDMTVAAFCINEEGVEHKYEFVEDKMVCATAGGSHELALTVRPIPEAFVGEVTLWLETCTEDVFINVIGEYSFSEDTTIQAIFVHVLTTRLNELKRELLKQ